MPASACLMNPMICSSVNLLFFMPVILLVDGLPANYVGTAGGGQVTLAKVSFSVSRYPCKGSHGHGRSSSFSKAVSAQEPRHDRALSQGKSRRACTASQVAV